MDQFANLVSAFIQTHGAWAGPILGLIAFGESVAIVGLFVPATAIMIVIGGLIGGGVIDPLPVFLWSVVGSILGDCLSYAVGRRIGPRIYYRRPLVNHREMVARARLFFRKYGFWSVLIGRFLGPIRSTIPLIAGVMGMPQRPFQMANVVSAIVWVPAMLAPGFLASRSLTQFDMMDGSQWILALVAIALMCLIGPLIAAKLLSGGKGRKRKTLSGTLR